MQHDSAYLNLALRHLQGNRKTWTMGLSRRWLKRDRLATIFYLQEWFKRVDMLTCNLRHLVCFRCLIGLLFLYNTS